MELSRLSPSHETFMACGNTLLTVFGKVAPSNDLVRCLARSHEVLPMKAASEGHRGLPRAYFPRGRRLRSAECELYFSRPRRSMPSRWSRWVAQSSSGDQEAKTNTNTSTSDSSSTSTSDRESPPSAVATEEARAPEASASPPSTVIPSSSSDGGGSAGDSGEGPKEKQKEKEKEQSKAQGSNPSPSPGPSMAQFQSFSVSDLLGPEKVDPEDVKVFRDKLCGISSFFVTGQEPFGDAGEGVLLLGNMRGGRREDVYARLKRGMAALFADKYELFMVEEPARADADGLGGTSRGREGEQRRVSFVLVRRDVVNAPPVGAWQYVIALVLLGVTAGACLELGLATQISKVPPEVLAYFTSPNPEGEPPALETLTPFVRDALPVAYGVLGVQLFHELGHQLTARQRRVSLGVPFLIPNITIGSFGSITQFRSPCPDRAAKFDVSVAGPVAGGALSLAMFLAGLALSANAVADPAAVAGTLGAGIQGLAQGELVKVPSLLFQGSLLLGLLSRAALGYDALHAATVSIHPLLITGWCGLTVSALNLLPVGSLDGGRAMQAAFGRSTTVWTSTAVYILLGLGQIGGTLSLPFGLYVLLLQRNLEKPALNDVTEVSTGRKVALGVLLALSLGILLPVWEGLAESAGIGLESVGSIAF